MKYADVVNTNCQLSASGRLLFLHLMRATNNNPCTTGCAWYNDGNCPDYQKIKREQPVKGMPTVYEETNAQMAKRLGITKRQASKIRKR